MSRFAPAVFAALLCPVLALADWPLSRGDALMTGVGKAQIPDKLEVRWSVELRDGKRAGGIEGAPVVAGGVVYIASLDKHLRALELATGKEKWKTKVGHVKGAVAFRADRVYVGNLDGLFHCVDATNGKVLWTFETGGEIQAAANFHGENIIFGSHDSNLYCLNPKGEKLWAAAVDGPINAATPVVGDTAFATGCSDGVLHVIDVKNGKDLGTLDLGGQTVTTAAVVGDRLYSSMVSNQVVAADLKKREKVWSFEAAKRQQPFYSSPAVAVGLVIAGSRDNNLYAVNAATGKQEWVFPTAGSVDAAPVIVGERVYVGCLADAGNFYVLDLKSGRKLQELELDAPVTGSVAVGPDCVLVGTDDGTLYCLGKK